MPNNLRARKVFDSENGVPGLEGSGDLRSRKCLVAGNNRCRKSSDTENSGIGAGSSDSAYNWLMRAGGGSSFPWLSAARQPAHDPPGEAPVSQHTSSGCVPIHGCDALPELLQSSGSAVRQVCWVVLVGTSFGGHRSAESDTFSDANKQAEWLHSTSKKCPYAYVNGSFCRCLLELPIGGSGGSLLALKGGCK